MSGLAKTSKRRLLGDAAGGEAASVSGPSLDLEKYAVNSFDKCDSYPLAAYEESRLK